MTSNKLTTNGKNQSSSSNTKDKLFTSTSISNSYSTDSYTDGAKLISEQIRDDKNECRSVIAQYGVDPNELLHLLEQWTQHLIYEFKEGRERFNFLLKEKWERGELSGMKLDDDSNRRLVYLHMQKLQEWQQTRLTMIKSQLDELQPTSNVKEITKQLTDDLLDITSSIIAIHQNAISDHNNDRTKSLGLPTYLNETIEQLKRIQKINEQEHNTICIIGLEKAGKSSFINALLGFELLPFRIERCTQIQTILKPPSKHDQDLFATIEFYDANQFSALLNKLPREKDETDDRYQKRKTSICQTRHQAIPTDTLIKTYQASDENARQRATEELHKYIADEIYLNIVKHVTIYTTKLPGENYILLDVPGCDSPIEEHRRSAINAVQNADAFLFLTDGQRPSLTNDQICLLKEIQEGHFDGMKRAFGIITKLDLCQTVHKYREHRAKTLSELEQKGFLHEHIFPVAANVSLLEATESDLDQLRQIKQRIHQYESLLDGFDQCKETLNNYIEYELPHSRFRQVANMAQQKMSRFVQDTLKVSRQLIPVDAEGISLDEYIKRLNTEKWNGFFDTGRYLPVLAKASHWQKDTLAVKRHECMEALIRYFHDEFQAAIPEIINKYHPIEQAMLEQHDIAVFQMNPYDIENKEREKIVEKMFQVVRHTSKRLAHHMYDKYVHELEKILNNICPEQEDVFRSSLTNEQCAIEVRTLVLRVTQPIIIATIRWAHIYENNRIEAAKELARIAPAIAFNVYENSQLVPGGNMNNLGKTMAGIFEAATTKNKQTGILTALFRC